MIIRVIWLVCADTVHCFLLPDSIFILCSHQTQNTPAVEGKRHSSGSAVFSPMSCGKIEQRKNSLSSPLRRQKEYLRSPVCLSWTLGMSLQFYLSKPPCVSGSFLSIEGRLVRYIVKPVLRRKWILFPQTGSNQSLFCFFRTQQLCVQPICFGQEPDSQAAQVQEEVWHHEPRRQPIMHLPLHHWLWGRCQPTMGAGEGQKPTTFLFQISVFVSHWFIRRYACYCCIPFQEGDWERAVPIW